MQLIKFHLILFFWMSFCFTALASVETREFDITVAGIKIGEMTAKKEVRDSITFYTVHSKVSFWLFVKIHVDYTVSTEYHHDKLMYSTVTTKSNKGDFVSTVSWTGKQYDVVVDGYKYENTTPIKEAIHFNSIRLYFDEPIEVKTLLAENFGVMAPVEVLEKRVTYRVNVLGNKNRFHYKQKVMHSANMYHPVKNFDIKLRATK